VSHLLGADEADLWPDVHADRHLRSHLEEIRAVYPHRWAVPDEVWHHLFESAHHEIDILAYSSFFLVRSIGFLGVLANKARAGVRIRITLGDPDSPHAAEGGAEEGLGDAIEANIRNALALYRPLLEMGNVEIRLHRATLYNSLYRADSDMLVNQHAHGSSAANSPVFHLRKGNGSDMFSSYADSFRRIWSSSKQAA